MGNIKEVNRVLQEQLLLIKPTKKEQEKIEQEVGRIKRVLEKKIKNKKIRAEVFIGGSLAKGTLIKKEKPDIDIFVRFDRKYEDEKLSEILKGIVGKAKRIHGSRDYFQITKRGILFEIVPVLKISRPEKAKNVTDLSYFHVNYIKRGIRKNKKLADEIRLAKSFCFAQKCYGAESYIRGFSGYALELLVVYYRGFVNFLRAIANSKTERIIIDAAKFYKNKNEIMWSLNESKLQSPVIFVDPTFKERNTLAALSRETFEKFRIACRRFLENPSKRFFMQRKINEKQFNLIIETKTSRQRGDIAGSKLRKFHNFLDNKMKKYFEIKKQDFGYNEKENKGNSYFKIQRKKEIIHEGPRITDIVNLTRFKRAHKGQRCFIKQGRAYCKEKINMTEKKFVENLKRDKKLLNGMGIRRIKVI